MKALLYPALLIFAFSTNGPTKEEAKTAYTDGLARLCGPKQLDMLSVIDLKMQADGFPLSPDQRQTVKHLQEASCHKEKSDASCENNGFLQAVLSMNKMDDFVAQICEIPRTCRGYGDCKPTP